MAELSDRHRARRTLWATSVWAVVLASVAVALVGGASPTGAAGGEFLSVATFGGANLDEGRAVAVDDAGNVSTTGPFEGVVEFDPGPGVANRTSAGFADVFVSGLHPNGQYQWATSFGSGGVDRGLGLAVDRAGHVHTTGYFQGAVDFDPGPGTANRSSVGVGDVFVSKLAAKGLCNGLAVKVDIAAGDAPTAGDDVILGTPGPDVIAGLGGNDTIFGGPGDDTIFGGPGDDTIFGGPGDDLIDGGTGNDIIDGGGGDDLLSGNAGTDTCTRDIGIDNVFDCENLLP